MGNPYFNDPVYGFGGSAYGTGSLATRLTGLLGQGQGSFPPASRGLLGGGGGGFSQLLDPSVALPVAAALMGGRNLQESLAGGFAAAAPGLAQMKKRKAINDWLTAGAPRDPKAPETMALMQAAPELADKYIGAQFNTDSGAEYGMTPVWGRDETGKMVLMQMSNKGGMSRVDTKGIEPLDPLHFVNTGTAVLPVGSRTGEVRSGAGGAIPIDVAGKAAAAKSGEMRGQAQANWLLAEHSADRMIKSIDAALHDPNLSSITGSVDARWPNALRSGDSQRAQSRIDQILGETFLQAYNDLRGAGQISDAEGQSAKSAYNRLQSQGQSDDSYRQALTDFRQEVLKLKEIARRRAEQPGGEAVPWVKGDFGAGGGSVVPFTEYFK